MDIGGATHTYTRTFAGWDSYQEASVTGVSTNSNYRTTTNTLSYDGYGRLIGQREHTNYSKVAINDRQRYYAYTGDGLVQLRREARSTRTPASSSRRPTASVLRVLTNPGHGAGRHIGGSARRRFDFPLRNESDRANRAMPSCVEQVSNAVAVGLGGRAESGAAVIGGNARTRRTLHRPCALSPAPAHGAGHAATPA